MLIARGMLREECHPSSHGGFSSRLFLGPNAGMPWGVHRPADAGAMADADAAAGALAGGGDDTSIARHGFSIMSPPVQGSVLLNIRGSMRGMGFSSRPRDAIAPGGSRRGASLLVGPRNGGDGSGGFSRTRMAGGAPKRKIIAPWETSSGEEDESSSSDDGDSDDNDDEVGSEDHGESGKEGGGGGGDDRRGRRHSEREDYTHGIEATRRRLSGAMRSACEPCDEQGDRSAATYDGTAPSAFSRLPVCEMLRDDFFDPSQSAAAFELCAAHCGGRGMCFHRSHNIRAASASGSSGSSGSSSLGFGARPLAATPASPAA